MRFWLLLAIPIRDGVFPHSLRLKLDGTIWRVTDILDYCPLPVRYWYTGFLKRSSHDPIWRKITHRGISSTYPTGMVGRILNGAVGSIIIVLLSSLARYRDHGLDLCFMCLCVCVCLWLHNVIFLGRSKRGKMRTPKSYHTKLNR